MGLQEPLTEEQKLKFIRDYGMSVIDRFQISITTISAIISFLNEQGLLRIHREKSAPARDGHGDVIPPNFHYGDECPSCKSKEEDNQILRNRIKELEGIDQGPELPRSAVMAWKKPLVIKAWKEGLSARACGRVFGIDHDTAAKIVEGLSRS